jgi:hypothetical protein
MDAPHRTGTRLQLFSRRLIFRFASKGVFGTRQIAVNVILSSRIAVANASPADFGEVELKVPIDPVPRRLPGLRSFTHGFAPGRRAFVGDLICHVCAPPAKAVGSFRKMILSSQVFPKKQVAAGITGQVSVILPHSARVRSRRRHRSPDPLPAIALSSARRFCSTVRWRSMRYRRAPAANRALPDKHRRTGEPAKDLRICGLCKPSYDAAA